MRDLPDWLLWYKVLGWLIFILNLFIIGPVEVQSDLVWTCNKESPVKNGHEDE